MNKKSGSIQSEASSIIGFVIECQSVTASHHLSETRYRVSLAAPQNKMVTDMYQPPDRDNEQLRLIWSVRA